MNETSTTASVAGGPGSSPGASRRALTPSSSVTRSSARRRSCSCPRPTSSAVDVRRPALQEAIGEAARRGADVEADEPGHVDRERLERRRQLVSAARHVRRPLVDLERGVRGDRRPGLGDEAPIDTHAPGHDERLGATTRLHEPALAEQLIESRHAAIVGHACPSRRPSPQRHHIPARSNHPQHSAGRPNRARLPVVARSRHVTDLQGLARPGGA